MICRRCGRRVRPGTGTWCYLAPKQAAATSWACRGHHPQEDRRAPRARRLRRSVPRELDDLLGALLEPDPSERPPLDAAPAVLAPLA